MPELRSPLARATVPVAAGIVVIAIMAGLLWLLAAYISNNPDNNSERITPSEWIVGPVDALSEIVASDGPLLFQEPGSGSNDRSIVIDHTGKDPTTGWRVYWAYPADRDHSCRLSQIRGDDAFVDCEGRTVHVEDLAPPDKSVFPRVDDRTTLVIDFRDVDDDA